MIPFNSRKFDIQSSLKYLNRLIIFPLSAKDLFTLLHQLLLCDPHLTPVRIRVTPCAGATVGAGHAGITVSATLGGSWNDVRSQQKDANEKNKLGHFAIVFLHRRGCGMVSRRFLHSDSLKSSTLTGFSTCHILCFYTTTSRHSCLSVKSACVYMCMCMCGYTRAWLEEYKR